MKKWVKGMNRRLTKEDMHITNKHTKEMLNIICI